MKAEPENESLCCIDDRYPLNWSLTRLAGRHQRKTFRSCKIISSRPINLLLPVLHVKSCVGRGNGGEEVAAGSAGAGPVVV